MLLHSNERKAFRRMAKTYTKQLIATLELTNTDIDSQWEALELDRQQHQERLLEIGYRPNTRDEGVLRMNIGGSPANVHRSLIAKAGRESAFGALVSGVWDKRVPRDSDGRIVLDESPTCLKHIIHTLLNSCVTPSVSGGHTSRSAVAADEEAYLMYISHVLGLSAAIPTFQKRMLVEGGSVIASSPFDIPVWSSVIRGWCPGEFNGLRLLYRASRDGFSSEKFRRAVGGTATTITLVQARAPSGGTESTSVVGGYSGEASWNSPSAYGGPRRSNSAFIFMLDSPEEGFEPVRWGLKSGSEESAVNCCGGNSSQYFGPCFGNHDMRVNFHPTTECTLSTGRGTYDVDGESTFLALNGGVVLDVEVFRVYSVPEQVETPASSEIMSWDQHFPVDQSLAAEYILKFGESIAGLLMEELMALAYARAELQEAVARTTAAARALCVTYGPYVARGEEDPVVELNVRGRSITTLYSTLHACPDSVFAAWFAERWSGGKGVDEDGRYKVNCDPSCFSKILDVMRMRKRAGWAEDDQIVKNAGGGDTIRVRVSEADREKIEDAAKMYFPNCTGFIMDLVGFTG